MQWAMAHSLVLKDSVFMPPKEEGMCGEEIPLYLFCVIDCFRHKYVYFVLNLKGIAKLIRFYAVYPRRWIKCYVLRV